MVGRARTTSDTQRLGLRPVGTGSNLGRPNTPPTGVCRDAQALQAAGAFSLVLEKVPARLAAKLSEELDIPTIGIGAGLSCDGQILVTHDMLGLFTRFRPRFVRRYAELAEATDAAIRDYVTDVRGRKFPGPSESY